MEKLSKKVCEVIHKDLWDFDRLKTHRKILEIAGGWAEPKSHSGA